MDGGELMVDGNALAGTLREVFMHEMTVARISCGGCGQAEPIGAQHAYVQAPGMVLRCSHCEQTLLVLTRGSGRYVLGLPGARWLDVAMEPEPQPEPRG